MEILHVGGGEGVAPCARHKILVRSLRAGKQTPFLPTALPQIIISWWGTSPSSSSRAFGRSLTFFP